MFKAMEKELLKDAENLDKNVRLKSPNPEKSPTPATKGNQNNQGNGPTQENKSSAKPQNERNRQTEKTNKTEEKSGRNKGNQSMEEEGSNKKIGPNKKQERKRERSRSQEKRNEKQKSQDKRNEKQKDQQQKQKDQQQEQKGQQQEQESPQTKNNEGQNRRDLREPVRGNENDSGKKKDLRERISKRDRSREGSPARPRDKDRDRDYDRDRDRSRGGRDDDRDRGRDYNRDRDRDYNRGRDRDYDRDRDRNRRDYRERNRDRSRSRDRSKERHRDRSNERDSNRRDWRQDRFSRDKRENSDGRYSKANANVQESAEFSEPESENFLKFPEDENAPKKRMPLMKKAQFSESKDSAKRSEMAEEEVLSRPIVLHPLPFALDAEPVTFKADTEPQKEAMTIEIEKKASAEQDENNKLAMKKPSESRSGKKERSSGQDDPSKSCYKILGQDRVFYTRETNIITKLQDYLVETNADEPKEGNDELNEEKKDEDDGLDEHYNFQNRYFIENPSQVCRRCRRAGHFERMCPETLSIRCLFCCGQHLTSTCDQFICFRCNGLGHKTKDCMGSGGGNCYKCNKRGHKASQCGVIVPLKKNYNASMEEKREWRQETKCLCCERYSHINCNKEGIAIGTEMQVDDLYTQKLLQEIEKEFEYLSNHCLPKEGTAPQKRKAQEEEASVLIAGSLLSSESDEETPRKPLSRKSGQSNGKSKKSQF